MLLPKDKKIKIYFYLSLFLLISTFYNTNSALYFNSKFKVINIENLNDNMKIYELNYLLNNNIFNIDKKILSYKLKNYPILESYEIKKIYPDTIRIRLVKSNPIAKIIQNGKTVYLGDNGKIFKQTQINDQIPEILGVINLEYINRIIKIINNSSFKLNKIKVIKIYPSNRFDLIFNNSDIIKFPHNVDQEFIEDAFIFYENNTIYSKIIDLRLKNKIITRNEWSSSFF